MSWKRAARLSAYACGPSKWVMKCVLCDDRPLREARQAQAAILDATGRVGAHSALAEGALPRGETAARAPGVFGGEAGALVALRQHVLDPRPARAGRPDLGAAAQLRAQVGDAPLRLLDGREGRAVHRRVALGDERRAAEPEPQDGRYLGAVPPHIVPNPLPPPPHPPP